MRTSILYVLFLILPLCAQARAVDFKDWTVGCDNVKGCIALGFDGAEENGFIHVERAGGPSGRAKIRLILSVEDAKGPLSLRLTSDGVPIAGVASEREARIAKNDPHLVESEISPQELQPFIAALRGSETLNLATVDGKHKADISLHGAVAALLKMDDIQGRAGTQTALIKAGGKPPTAVPDAPPLPVIVRANVPRGVKANPALASMLRERVEKEVKTRKGPDSDDDDDCSGPPEGSAVHDLVEPLDGSRTLVGLICDVAAYNVLSKFWIVTGANVATAVPVAFEKPGSTETGNELVNAEFDGETLSFFAKARGVGDSGTMGKYVWTGETFVLVERAELEHGGAPSDYWPVLWRAKVK